MKPEQLKELIEEFFKKSGYNLESLNSLKNLLVKAKHYELAAYIRNFEKEKFPLTKIEITQDEIDKCIAFTEKRGELVHKYLERYKGQLIYNEIALAIEFGYQLALSETDVSKI